MSNWGLLDIFFELNIYAVSFEHSRDCNFHFINRPYCVALLEQLTNGDNILTFNLKASNQVAWNRLAKEL